MGCAGSKAEAPEAPEPSRTPAAEAAPPPGRQKSAMKSSSSGVKSGKESAPKVGFSATQDDEALKVPIDEDQVDLELERADGLRTGSSGQQYQISRTAEAKLSDKEFGGSDEARWRAKSFANYGKAPVASVVVDGVSQKSPSGSAVERYGLQRSNSTTGVSPPKHAVVKPNPNPSPNPNPKPKPKPNPNPNPNPNARRVYAKKHRGQLGDGAHKDRRAEVNPGPLPPPLDRRRGWRPRPRALPPPSRQVR